VLSHTAVVAAHTATAGAAATATADATVSLQTGDGASVAAGDIFRPTNNSPVGVNFQLREIISISGDVVSVSADWATVPTSATTYDIYQGMLLDDHSGAPAVLQCGSRCLGRFDPELSREGVRGRQQHHDRADRREHHLSGATYFTDVTGLILSVDERDKADPSVWGVLMRLPG
jgi:hypothetical protein